MSADKRPAEEIIVLGLALVVALTVTASVAAMLWIKVHNPAADVDALARQIGGFLSSLIALLVGYLAGRRLDR